MPSANDVKTGQALDLDDGLFQIVEHTHTKPGKGIIAIELDAGRKVRLTGFGTFATKHRAARTGRNPATGATIQLAAKTYPTFKAGKGLKDRVAD